MNWITILLALLISPTISGAQDNNSPDKGGRWTPAGTFAYSGLPNNEIREDSYSRSSEENNRISTFLPGMTIIYKTAESADREGFVKGVTQNGIPVQIEDSSLSSSPFIEKPANHVVVHRDHEACRNSTCSGDPLKVRVGNSFSIVHEDEEKIELVNVNELHAFYPKLEFTRKETSGFLTRHKDRINPRWSIYDGYAGKLSTKCSEQIYNDNFEIRVPIAEYESDPSGWEVNDERWSLKGIEIFDLGKVQQDNSSGEYVGKLDTNILDPNSEFVSIDMSVFAYRDSSWKPNYFKFAGILQIVNCYTNQAGKSSPTYVKGAYLYFDKQTGDNYEQDFPLNEQELPSQFSDEENQSKIYSYVSRSFYYSVNSPEEYDVLFDQLSEIISQPTAVSNVIARLNASCNESDRQKCREYSKFSGQ